MASCDYCGTTILFGGKQVAGLRYCSDRCAASGQALAASHQVADDLVQQQVWRLHQGLCPKCGGSGPVDVHTSYQVWSALLLTRWSSLPQVSCRSCGRNRQLTGILFSLVLGWWGFPWGLIVTPVQIGRNLAAMMKGPAPDKPSPQLEKLVRLNLGRGLPAVQPVQPR
jgi:hypothetical protein